MVSEARANLTDDCDHDYTDACRLCTTDPAVREVLDLRTENAKFRAALMEILRTSNDGESMQIAAKALGLSIDNTEP